MHRMGLRGVLLAGVAATSAGLALSAAVAGAARPPVRAAATETVLHSFAIQQGAALFGALVQDGAGNFYGTASGGGTSGNGSVFKLHPVAGGGYTFRVLYSFQGGRDGNSPFGSLLIDKSGRLFGTTELGGVGQGVVFDLTPAAGGTYTESVVYRFKGGADGSFPLGGLTLDAKGDLLGTTYKGGSTTFCGGSGCGTAFKLAPAGAGWREGVIYSFGANNGADGDKPEYGSLATDSAGNIYGTTVEGGVSATQLGVVFELTPNGATWTETVLHSFSGSDGAFPLSGVILDGAGNLYGVTNSGDGSANSQGTVFELAHSGGGWKLKTLTRFHGGADGAEPFGAPVLYKGSLFGTTFGGGTTSIPSGTVYQLTPRSGGSWAESVIYSFGPGGSNASGYDPIAGLIAGVKGGLFGTTEKGGSADCVGNGCGVVYKITP